MLYYIGSVALIERRGVFFLDAQHIVPGVQTAVLTLPPPDSLCFWVGEEWVVTCWGPCKICL